MKRKLLAAFLPLALIPLIGAGSITYILAKRTLTEKAFAHLESIASLQKSRVDDFLNQHMERFDLVADQLQTRIAVDQFLPYPTRKDRKRLNQILMETQRKVQGFRMLSIVSPKGNVLASTDPALIDRDLSQQPIFAAGKNEPQFDVLKLDGAPKFGAYFAGPLKQEKELLGVLFIEESMDRMVPWIRDNSGLGRTGEAFLVKRLPDNQALYLTALRFDSNASMQRVAVGQEDGPLNQALMEIEKPILSAVDYRGQPIIATTRFVKKMNWGLVVKIDQAEAFGSVTELRNWFLFFLAISVLSIVVLTHVLAKSIIGPLSQLTRIAQDVESGLPWPSQQKLKYKNEIGILAAAFRSMAGNLLRAKDDLEQRIRQRTEELTKSEERSRRIIETANDAFAEFDNADRILDWNRQAEIIFGWTAEEAAGKLLSELILPVRYQNIPFYLQSNLSSREDAAGNRRVEITAKHKDGHEFPVELTVWQGRTTPPCTYNAFIHDIGRRKEMEEELRKSRAFLNSIVENIPNMIFVKSAEDLRFVSFNKAGEELLGVSREELIGKNDYDFFPPEEADFFTEKDQQVLMNRKLADIGEEPIHTKKHGLRILHTKKMPIFDERGTPRYLLGISEDITERKQSEQFLLDQKAELARSKAEREQLQLFASVAAHDLQEPLQKIVAFGDLLRIECEKRLGSDGQDYLNRMRNAAKRMSELISDLLRFSKAATKEEPLETVDLKLVLEEVLSDLELRIQETGAKIEIETLPILRANRVQMREVFQNLIGNAIKFQKKNEKPHVAVRGADVGENTVEITVSDNGIGFDEKFAERIFRPFERLHRRNEYAGSGIGLAICQRIIARHGGKINVKSELGKGSIFKITMQKELAVKNHVYDTAGSIQ